MSYRLLGFTCLECKHKFEELVWVDSEDGTFDNPKCEKCEKGYGVKDGIQSKNPRDLSWSLWAAGN